MRILYRLFILLTINVVSCCSEDPVLCLSSTKVDVRYSMGKRNKMISKPSKSNTITDHRFLQGIPPNFLRIPSRVCSYPDRYVHTQTGTFIPTQVRSYPNRYVHIQTGTFIPKQIRSYPDGYVHTQLGTFIPKQVRSYPDQYVHIQTGMFIPKQVRSYPDRYVHIQTGTFIPN